MKQKYMIYNGENENELKIRESAELDKGLFFDLIEESYDSQLIRSASEQGEAAIIAAVRTKSFFPVTKCAERLAGAITEFYRAGGSEPVEIQFDDLETLSTEKAKSEFDDDSGSDVELDELLDDDSDKDDDLLGEDDIKDIASNASLKVADDDGLGHDDDL